MIKTMKVIAVNKPYGTITIKWNNDDDMEWNYFIPIKDDGDLMGMEEMKRHLISVSAEGIERVIAARIEAARRDFAACESFDEFEGREFNVEGLWDEYREIQELTG